MSVKSDPSPAPRSVSAADLQALAASSFFHPDWYLAQNPDVVAAGMTAAAHYLLFGGTEGRDPGPHFSSSNYLRGNPDVRDSGMNPLLHYIHFGQGEGRLISSLHEQWIEQNGTLDSADRQAIQQHIQLLLFRPLISIIIPVYRIDPDFLRQTLDSVKKQAYPNWECCIADDCSEQLALQQILRETAAEDSRFRIAFRTENGNICAASNTALALATGEFVCFLDHDDLLHENALYEVAVELNAHPETDLVFSDFDCLDQEGHFYKPYFKTAWNYDLMLGHNMVSHLGIYRRSLIESLGGFRMGFEGSQDYDLALRIADASQPDRIRHIPAILYHWRRSTGHQSFSNQYMERCLQAAQAAIADHLQRRAIHATVEPCPTISAFHRVVYALPDPAPLVTVGIMATADPGDTERCLADILLRTGYQPLEILVQTAHCEGNGDAAFKRLETSGCVRVLPPDAKVSATEARNQIVLQARGEVVILIDADLTISHLGRMEELVSQALRADVGLVAPLITNSCGTLISTGIVIGATTPNFAAKSGDQGYYGVFALTREVSAVRSACVSFRRSVFLGHQGYTQQPSLLESEIELSQRMRRAGLRSIVTPYCTLSCSTGAVTGAAGTGVPESNTVEDHFYNPNLSLDQLFSATCNPSRRVNPWSQSKKLILAENHRAQRTLQPDTQHKASAEMVVGIAGTFDIENYGDLLYPLIAAKALSQRNPAIRVVPYSLNPRTGADWPFEVESVANLPAQIASLGAVLIGGGQIFRFDKFYPVPVPPSAHPPLDYWLIPAVLAALTGKPVIWNAVGAWTDSPSPGQHTHLVRQILSASYFVGVRDAASQKHLEHLAPEATVELLPDTAFSLSHLWPLHQESAEFQKWRGRLGVQGKYVVLQGSAAVARCQEKIQTVRESLRGVPAVVVPICWCHGDRADHFEHWPATAAFHNDWLPPLLITEILGRAEFVFASSMHACITALSYGVPAVRISSSSDRKFQALSHFEGLADLNDSQKVCRLFERDRHPEMTVQNHIERLERYWDNVAQVIQHPPATHLNESRTSLLQWVANRCVE